MRFAILLLLLAARAWAQQHVPGRFDYYVLSLSWSPEYCASPAGARNSQQCGEGRRYGFVVHGLWPQYERGWPQDCVPAAPIDRAIVTRMLPLMPAEKLIEHQWRKHGSCSGLDPSAYFQLVEKAFLGFRIPDSLRQPLKEITFTPNDLRQRILAANPGYPRGSVALACSGRYLSEVRICLTKDLQPRECSSSVRDTCRAESMILRPIR